MYRDGAPAGPPAAGRAWGGAQKRRPWFWGIWRGLSPSPLSPGPPVTPRALWDGHETPPGGTAPGLRREGVGPWGGPSLGTCPPHIRPPSGWGFCLLMQRRKRKDPPTQPRGGKGVAMGSAAMVPHAAAAPPGVSQPRRRAGGCRGGKAAPWAAPGPGHALRSAPRGPGASQRPRSDPGCWASAARRLPAPGGTPVPAPRPGAPCARRPRCPRCSSCQPPPVLLVPARCPQCSPHCVQFALPPTGLSHGDSGDIHGMSGGDRVAPPGARIHSCPPSPCLHGRGSTAESAPQRPAAGALAGLGRSL